MPLLIFLGPLVALFFLSTIAPKLLGINLPEECKKIDEKSQKVIEGYGIYSGASVVEYRSFIIAENHVGQTWNGALIWESIVVLFFS
ncbi:hypothetical protein [Cellulosilyticum sp. WCF-2]|uniref:hypothetical protein n=1 Tax=Cellulosilyticum sp. WCF-2 TaxID=2497860 RepID=UPI000F8DB7BF|nr:hypothetical protein [Cellulosilyticum sp. WCF-2]QEH69406.1 hypothetical protein EKH84_13815 [Cellulosilyticum sp. WCF-2]